MFGTSPSTSSTAATETNPREPYETIHVTDSLSHGTQHRRSPMAKRFYRLILRSVTLHSQFVRGMSMTGYVSFRLTGPAQHLGTSSFKKISTANQSCSKFNKILTTSDALSADGTINATIPSLPHQLLSRNGSTSLLHRATAQRTRRNMVNLSPPKNCALRLSGRCVRGNTWTLCNCGWVVVLWCCGRNP